MRIRLWVSVLLVTSVFVSVAPGGAPMGPPLAFLGEGQWALGGEYGYEQMSLTSRGTVTEDIFGQPSAFWTQEFRIKDLTSNMAFGTLSYGLGDNWDLFARIGASGAKDDIVVLPASITALERRDEYSGSWGFAWGAGTRATFYRTGPWSFGGLAQVTWFRPGDSSFSVVDPLIPDESWVGDVKLDYWQVQVSLAAAYQAEKLRVWAGPFLQFTRGNMDFTGSGVLNGSAISSLSWSSDVEESAQVGGHAGALLEIGNQFDLWLEGQITEDSWLASIGAVILPEKTFNM